MKDPIAYLILKIENDTPMTAEELAQVLGVTVERVMKALKALGC